MRSTNYSFWISAAITPLLAACGGGSGGGIASAPAPVPAPSPSPTATATPPPQQPPPFKPVPAKIFPEPLYNPQLTVTGKGWQHDYVPNTPGTLNLRDPDSFSISYDQTSKTYQVSAPVAGSGTIMRTGEYSTYPFNPGFAAEPHDKNATNYCCNSLSISASDHPQARYTYVSLIDLYSTTPAGPNLETIAYGAFAVGQPTKSGEVPITGTGRYTGNLLGYFAGNAGGSWVEGTSRFDFDFARALLTGDMTLNMQCMMGCGYDSVAYSLTDTHFTKGATTFSGSLATGGAPSNGSFSGMFAGPAAVEMMAQFQIPFFNPEDQRWITARGAIAGKRD